MGNLTKRQERILDALIEEYTKTAEPVSSKFLAKKKGFDVCPATIRNELQELTIMGYIYQPHTSAGRMPSEKAFRYFLDRIFPNKEKEFTEFIFREVRITRRKIGDELRLAEELRGSLDKMMSMLDFEYLPEKDNLLEVLGILGPSKTEHEKNISLMRSLLKSFEEL
jgi:heat-inducible transcriptional repressor